jgi:hypothetical protein
MAGLIKLVDDLTAFVQKEICDKIELKKKGERADAGYDYELVHPTAFQQYCPPDDKSRTPAPTVPSVTVQMDNIETERGEGDAPIALIFAVWNPGEHDNSDPDNKKFTKTPDGWRDLFAFAQKALDALEKNIDAGGYFLSSKVKFRPLHGEDALMGTYPYYYGEITFSVSNRNRGTPDEVEKLL